MGAHSLVTKDVEAETVVVGVPAKRLFKTSEIKHSDLSIGSAYPWTKHFHRGYPSEVVAEWQKGNYYYSPYGRSENG